MNIHWKSFIIGVLLVVGYMVVAYRWYEIVLRFPTQPDTQRLYYKDYQTLGSGAKTNQDGRF
jgi:hypothetical protein